MAERSPKADAAAALLLGRKTYEGLARVWPTITDDRGFADRINGLPKFVASRTLREPLRWNATLLQGDLVDSVSKLKQRPGGNLDGQPVPLRLVATTMLASGVAQLCYRPVPGEQAGPGAGS